MNELDLLTTIKSLLIAADWKASANPIFASGSIAIIATEQAVALEKLRCPFALIRPDTGVNDADEPKIVYQRFIVTVGVHVAGSNVGEYLMIGRGDTTTSSVSAGVLEVGQEMSEVIVTHLPNTAGIQIKEVARSRAAATIDERSREIAYRDYTFEAVIASSS